MAQFLLHGKLNVTIYEVGTLPIEIIQFWSIGNEVKKEFQEIWDLITGKKDVYATINLEEATLARTRVLQHEQSNPKWNENFRIYTAHMASNIIFLVKEILPLGSKVLGRAILPMGGTLLQGEEVDTWLDLLEKDHDKPIQNGLMLHVKVQFFPVAKEVNWDQGIGKPDFPGVPFTYFPQRKGCKVTLYQDAHVEESFAPRISLSGEKYYKLHRCWEDVFDAITSAKYLIYITGWSVYTKITLVRGPDVPKRPNGNMNLGELLKKKAEEGVAVLMLVWDDRTSLDILKNEGLMKTHDEDTRAYFNGSKVHCVLCPRDPNDGRSVPLDVETAAFFTHHQKSLVVDSVVNERSSGNKRRIVSFVGGIDLCDGRYDTQSHSLFRTLNTIHRDDFYQSCFEGASLKKGGPREPWHDIHSRLEGPIAWDVLSNFEQRWRMQGANNDLLLPLKEMDDIFIPPTSIATSLDDQETWNVQVFRSIDKGAAFGFPNTPQIAAEQGLVGRKDNIIDRSIQDAYINAIRRAKRFIYIENQYFLGSSFGWKASDDIKVEDVGALHLIPKEISLKIVSKIEKGERFSVYIVIPMWPEGYPDDNSVQAILDWQRRTMEMMYNDVAKALLAKGINANPKDYLSFFCLGNREIKRNGEYKPPETPNFNSDYSRAQISRRFMIYVHAKMMIVDDEYIIIGSANINQRSMDGARDTEIAMGGYQPYHLAKDQQPAKGQIHGFRMSLWFEHLGRSIDHTFLHPESLECVRKVNQIAAKNLELYSSDGSISIDLPGHLLTYPLAITQDGDVKNLQGFENFPDTKGRILGKKSDLIPPIITT